MNTKELLTNLAEDLDDIKERFCDLINLSEFEGKREEYLRYSNDLVQIKEQLLKDCEEVDQLETYTGTLDRI